jgi:hypothetical protein
MNRIALILILLAYPVSAATNLATSASQTHVQAAINSSVIGDTVIIPPGTAPWNNLQLNKGIALIGSGTNSTKIGCNGPAVTIVLSSDLPVRLSSISFTNTAAQPTLNIYGTLTAFRVDRCLFGTGKRAVYPQGYTYGVIDHCVFMNCDIAIAPQGDDDAAWLRPWLPGTTNAVVMEDNVFFVNGGDLNEQIYHQEGPRSVVRFNTFDGRLNTGFNSLFYECHGNQAPGFRGAVFTEVYGNTMRAHHTYRFMYWRSGMNFVYSNILTTISGSPIAIALSEEESWQTQFFSPLSTVWPAQDQITNNFFWANTLNGIAVTSPVLWHAEDAPFIQLNRDYWMSSPTILNGRPVGAWSSYRPLVHPHPMVTYQDTGYIPPVDPDPVIPPSAGTNKIGISLEGYIGNIFRP